MGTLCTYDTNTAEKHVNALRLLSLRLCFREAQSCTKAHLRDISYDDFIIKFPLNPCRTLCFTVRQKFK